MKRRVHYQVVTYFRVGGHSTGTACWRQGAYTADRKSVTCKACLRSMTFVTKGVRYEQAPKR